MDLVITVDKEGKSHQLEPMMQTLDAVLGLYHCKLPANHLS